jgi:hypothetical protein
MQMFLYLTPVYCSDESPIRALAFISFSAIAFFLHLLTVVSYRAATDASEALIFEYMMYHSIFVDCRVPNFKSTANYKYFLGILLFMVLMYFVTTSASISISAADINLSNSTSAFRSQSGSVVQTVLQLVSVLGGNLLAVAGGLYFIFTLRVESTTLGRSSFFVLRGQSVENAKKLSAMREIKMSQLKRITLAFWQAARVASLNIDNKYSSEQLRALKNRLLLPSHILSASSQLAQVIVESFVAASECVCRRSRVESAIHSLKRHFMRFYWLISGGYHLSGYVDPAASRCFFNFLGRSV